MLRYVSLFGALLMSSLPSLMACEGCKEPSNVIGNSGVAGISASFSWSVVFMLAMLGSLLTGMVLMMVRSCKQLASQHENVPQLPKRLAKGCYEMSRRDGAIVAWHEVPGTMPPQRAVP